MTPDVISCNLDVGFIAILADSESTTYSVTPGSPTRVSRSCHRISLQESSRREAAFASTFSSYKLTRNAGLLCATRKQDLSGDLSTALSASSVKTQHLHAAIPNLFIGASFEMALTELRKHSDRGLSWEECGMTDELAMQAFTDINFGARIETTIVSSINCQILLQAVQAGFRNITTVNNDLVGFGGGLAYIKKPGDPEEKPAYVGQTDLAGLCANGQQRIGWVIEAKGISTSTDVNQVELVFSSDSLGPQGVCSLFGSDSNFCLLLRRTGFTLLFRVPNEDFAPIAHGPQRRFTYYKIHNENSMLSFQDTSNVVMFIKILHEFARMCGVSRGFQFASADRSKQSVKGSRFLQSAPYIKGSRRKSKRQADSFAVAVDGGNDLIVAPVDFDEFEHEDITKIDEMFAIEEEREWRCQNVEDIKMFQTVFEPSQLSLQL